MIFVAFEFFFGNLTIFFSLLDWETTACLHKSSKVFFSTDSSKSGDNADNAGALDIGDDDFLTERPELTLQGVDPRKGWNFRGVHRVRL